MTTALAAHAADLASISAHRATTHSMRYHVALPSGWGPDRAWPVLVVIPDASREFEGNLTQFVRARRDRPYILRAPAVAR